MKVAIPAGMYFSIWGIVCRVLWRYGFTALEQTDLSGSVPPLVMSFFKYSFFLFIVHSFCYAIAFPILFRKCTVIHASLMLASNVGICWITSYKSFPKWERLVYSAILSLATLSYASFKPVPEKRKRWKFLHIVYTDNNDKEINGPFLEGMDGVPYEAYFCLYLPRLAPHFLHKYSLPKLVYNAILRYMVLYMYGLASLYFDSKKDMSRFLVALVSILTCAFWTLITREEGAVQIIAKNRIHSLLRNNKRKVKLVKFTVGVLGMVLFQYFFKLTSWDHVKAFLYITVSWLAVLVILCVSDDLGIFEFLLGNVVVGCTVSRYALGRVTWFAYVSAFLLYGLRLLLESVPLEDKQGLKVIALQIQPNSFLGKLFMGLIRNRSSKEEESAQRRKIFGILEIKKQGIGSADVVENGTQESESADVIENRAQEGQSNEVVINNETQERGSVEIVEHEIQEREGVDIVDMATQERVSPEIVIGKQAREWESSVEAVENETQVRETSDEIVEPVEYGSQERENVEIVEDVECEIRERKNGEVAVDSRNTRVEEYHQVDKLRRCTSCPTAN